MTEQSDGFLGRWARRKSQARSGAILPPEPESAAPAPLVPPAAPAPAGRPPVQPSIPGFATPAPSGVAADSLSLSGPAGQAGPAVPAPPTLQDAQQLTSASDFRPFVARAVAPEVRNAAFKQLFTDPHFNLMDGLDIYIDDYSKPDPLPLAVARELLAAHFPPAPAPTDSAAAAAPNAATALEPRPAPVSVAQALAPSAAPASAATRIEPLTSAGALEHGPEDPATAQ